MQADIIWLAEHNLAINQSHTRYELIKTIQRQLPNSKIVAATSKIKSPSAYKPGGYVQIIANTTISRITAEGMERFGQSPFVGLATRHKSMIFIVTASFKNHRRSGTLTVYNQQWTMMRNDKSRITQTKTTI